MRVRSLALQRYGAFTDRRVTFGDGLSLVIGPNEAGKSTTLEGLSDLLWGIPRGSGQDFLHGRPSLSLQGMIALAEDGTEDLAVHRTSSGLTQSDTGAAVPASWATAIDSRERWRESFGLSHGELREGGLRLCRGEGDLAELIFTARSGQVVRTLLAELQAEAEKLYRSHQGAKSVEVRKAMAEYENAQAQVKAATASGFEVQTARDDVERGRREVGDAEQRVARARATVAQAEQRQRAAPDARSLATARRRAELLLAEGPALQSGQLEEWDRTTSALERVRTVITELDTEVATLQEERGGLVVDDELLQDATEIQRLRLENAARLDDVQRAQESRIQAGSLLRQASLVLSDLLGDIRPEHVPDTLGELHVAADRAASLDALAVELATHLQQLAVRQDALQDALRRGAVDDTGVPGTAQDVVEAIRNVHDAIVAEGSAVSALRSAVDRRADATRRRQEALRRAGLPEAAGMPSTVPTPAAVAARSEALHLAITQAGAGHDRATRTAEALASVQQALKAAELTDVPEVGAVHRARQRRDAAVGAVVQGWLDGQPRSEAADLIREVERATADADALADRLVQHAEAVARRLSLEQQLEQRKGELADAELAQAKAQQNLSSAEAEWAVLWSSLDAPPALADASVVQHALDDARAAQEDVAAEEERLVELGPQVDRQAAALAAALERSGRQRESFDLDSLIVAAVGVLAVDDAARESRAAAEQLARSVSDARMQVDAAAGRLVQVQQWWREALVAAGIPEDLDGPGWARRRDLASAAQQHWRSAETHMAEAAAAEGRNALHSTALEVLVTRHEEISGPAALESMVERLEAATAARSRASRLDDQITQLLARLEDECSKRAAADEEQERLRLQTGVADAAGLTEAAERGRSLQGYLAEGERLAALVRAAAPDQELDELVAELADTEQPVLDANVVAARDRQRDADDALREALRRFAGAEQREQQLTTGGGSAELHARAQEHLAEVVEKVERYLVARIQADVLSAELEAYERKHASPLLDEAGVLLERLTAGRHVALAGQERSLVVVGADGMKRTPNQLSEGTADQVFLALRLAGIAELQEERKQAGAPSLPVVLDDVLMAFDDERAAAGLRVMAELSQHWQVIVFSHHQHLAELAESLCLEHLTISLLDPPPQMDASAPAEDVRRRAKAFTTPVAPAVRSAPAEHNNKSGSPAGSVGRFTRLDGRVVVGSSHRG